MRGSQSQQDPPREQESGDEDVSTSYGNKNTFGQGTKPSLEGAQERIRDAYFDHEAGLFVLECVPGAGKSHTVERIAAEVLLQQAAADVSVPEQGLCVTSFSREDAAAVRPGIAAWVETLVARDAVPAAKALTDADVFQVIRRLRRAEHIGTIDSVLRSVMAEIAGDLGFAEMPSVGEESRLASLHEEVFADLRSDPAYAKTIANLEEAYPDEHTPGVAALLRDGLQACRERRLSVAAFRDRLQEIVAAVYPDGPPDSTADIVAAVERCLDAETARAFASDLSEADSDAYLTADRTLHEAWRTAIEQFCDLLSAYEAGYTEATRERSVLTHVDCAHWVAVYFERDCYAGIRRTRLRERYRTLFTDVFIDEAQDISVVQHDALAPLVDGETRVFLVGDRTQSIYSWRNARPDLFATALDEGQYLGRSWGTCVTETAHRTYRLRPDLAASVTAVMQPIFADGTRGGLDQLDSECPPLEPARDGVPGPNIHIAAFRPRGPPGSGDWVAPETEDGEADALAAQIAGGLADGTFGSGDSRPGVTVLFPRRTHMRAYAEAFERYGLSVAIASEYLFASPLAQAVAAVCRWLVAPTVADRTRRLVVGSSIPFDEAVIEQCRSHDWSVLAVAADEEALDAVPPEEARVLTGLAQLVADRSRLRAVSGVEVISTIIDRLTLPTDPLGMVARPAHPEATCDALTALVEDWDCTGNDTVAALATRLDTYTDTPRRGPRHPAPAPDSRDVVFKTVFQAKGDEDDVVAIADPAADIGTYSPVQETLCTQGETVALAPPADALTTDQTLPTPGPYSHALFEPGREVGDADAGLRWASNYWIGDDTDGDGNETVRLAGPPILRSAVASHRAERWRLLFVALTRAREHLVVPLPRTQPFPAPRDRWTDALRTGLEFDGSPLGGTYELTAERSDGSTRTVTIGVNDVAPVSPTADMTDTRPNDTGIGTTVAETTTPSKRSQTWSVRHLSPSNFYPLAQDPEGQFRAHLTDESLHSPPTDIDPEVPDAVAALDPEVVGTVVHETLTAAVNTSVTTAALLNYDGAVPRLVDGALRETTLSRSEESAVRKYLQTEILPQFAESDLWRRLTRATTVFVEEPLETVVRIDGVDVTVTGQADFVSQTPAGAWYVDEVKLALAAPRPATTKRYELQTRTYAWILTRQLMADNKEAAIDIEAQVTRVGVETGTHPVRWPPDIVRIHLEKLIDCPLGDS